MFNKPGLGLLVLLFMLGLSAKAQEPGFPVPTGNNKQLFYLQRTPNVNTIVYELNYKPDGSLDDEKPVHEFWIRYGEQGQKEELSYLQRKFAYGIQSKKTDATHYELNFVSYKKYKIYLEMASDRKYYVFTTINNKKVILTYIYLKINKGGSFWSPNIDYVEITGRDPLTQAIVKTRMKV